MSSTVYTYSIPLSITHEEEMAVRKVTGSYGAYMLG